MKKILWVSKNNPIKSQIDALKRLFGDDVRVVIDGSPFSSFSDIVSRYRKGNYDEMVLIAPLSICRLMTECGIKPLWSEMKSVSTGGPDAEVTVQGAADRVVNKSRSYKFLRFRRLEKIDMTFSELDS